MQPEFREFIKNLFNYLLRNALIFLFFSAKKVHFYNRLFHIVVIGPQKRLLRSTYDIAVLGIGGFSSGNVHQVRIHGSSLKTLSKALEQSRRAISLTAWKPLLMVCLILRTQSSQKQSLRKPACSLQSHPHVSVRLCSRLCTILSMVQQRGSIVMGRWSEPSSSSTSHYVVST